EEADSPDRFALQRLAGDDAIGAVGFAIRAGEQRVEVVKPHRAAFSARRRELRAVADDESIAAHVGDVVLRHVITQGPHQLRHGNLGARGHPAIAWWIELQKPELSLRVLDGEPRGHTVALGRGDGPFARLWTRR